MTLITGVEDFVVERRGNDRLRPQSPLCSDACGVVIDICVGCGNVAVSELKGPLVLICPAGGAKGGGTENTLEARRRAAPGAILREADIATENNGRKATPESDVLVSLVEVNGDWCPEPRLGTN